MVEALWVAPADFPAVESGQWLHHTRIGKLGEEVPDGAPIIGEWRDFAAYAIYNPARSPSGAARKVTQIPGSPRSLVADRSISPTQSFSHLRPASASRPRRLTSESPLSTFGMASPFSRRARASPSRPLWI